MRRYAAKVDQNQAQIVKTLREVPGCVVKDLSRMGDGWPDLAAGYRGTNFYFEVKRRGKKLTDAQRKWHAEWTGSVHIVHDADEALLALGITSNAVQRKRDNCQHDYEMHGDESYCPKCGDCFCGPS